MRENEGDSCQTAWVVWLASEARPPRVVAVVVVASLAGFCHATVAGTVVGCSVVVVAVAAVVVAAVAAVVAENFGLETAAASFV